MEVYPAGEQPIAGADSRSLCHSIRVRGRVDPIFVQSEIGLHEIIAPILRPEDVVLTQGAGSVGGLAKMLADNGFRS
jgi:UDP-N-acetylmuramate--alanine ligase